MALIKYNPFAGFDSIVKRMNDLFADFDREKLLPDFSVDYSGFFPKVDIKEDEKNYYIKVELPGVKKEDLKITVNDENILQIRGQKKFEEKKENENYIRMETSYGEFARSFALPENVKKDEIQAKYNDGVLNLTIEKVEPSKPKETEIKIK